MTSTLRGARQALVVASYAYEDPKLTALRAPAQDVVALSTVLADAEIGAFDVDTSVNEPHHQVQRRISAFFRDCSVDDTLLLHFSCHGLKDEDGHLYFAATNTCFDDLEATAVPAEFLNRQMTRSRSRRIVLLLDCCYSGAFASGMSSRGDPSVHVRDHFDGRGRVVLTASTAMEYAFEGDRRTGAGTPSVFTEALVHGLSSGEADRDQDGLISINELYDHVYDRVRDETPNQTPGKWTYGEEGTFVVARSRMKPKPAPPPLGASLAAALDSTEAFVRYGAVSELEPLGGSERPEVAQAARSALERLMQDDSRRVAQAAEEALARMDAPTQPAPAGIPAPDPAPARVSTSPPAAALPPRRRPSVPRWAAAAIGVAAIALVSGLVIVLLRSPAPEPAVAGEKTTAKPKAAATPTLDWTLAPGGAVEGGRSREVTAITTRDSGGATAVGFTNVKGEVEPRVWGYRGGRWAAETPPARNGSLDSVVARGSTVLAGGNAGADVGAGPPAVWIRRGTDRWIRHCLIPSCSGRGTVWGVASDEQGYVAVGVVSDKTNHPAVWYSPDGEKWKRVYRRGRGAMRAVVRIPSRFIAVGNTERKKKQAKGVSETAAIWKSRDGVRWSRIETPGEGLGARELDSVAFGKSTVVAVGHAMRKTSECRQGNVETRAKQGAALASRNGGATWQPTDSPAFRDQGVQHLVGVVAIPGGFVALGSDQLGCDRNGALDLARAWTSADGSAWTRANVALQRGSHVNGGGLIGKAVFAGGNGAIWRGARG